MADLIRLDDESGEILPYARQLLDALTFFPDDELSFKICRFAIEQEYREHSESGPKRHQVSKAMEVLINAAEKRATQVYVAGLVALAIYGLKVTGARASQEASARLVSELNSKANEFPFERWDHKLGKRVDYLRAVQGDQSSIRQIFTKYRSVAHVCAARVVSTSYLQPLPLFEPAKEADASKLATVLVFQSFFDTKIRRTEKWNLRMIGHPASIGPNPVLLEPEREMMEAILGEQN